jgi:FkbM family methyltransferase
MLGSKLPMIDVVDVGAMWMGAESVGYMPLLKAGVAKVVGFEPNKPECDRLNELKMPNNRYLPYFVGDGREAIFYLTSSPMTSSIYEPNLRLLSKFNTLAELTTPVSQTPCQTRRLDDIPEITNIDFLKIDVQGAELDVIRGGPARLKDTVMIVTEVEFLEMYKGQPLFADVDQEMRRQGFGLHVMGSRMGPALKPFVIGGDPNKRVRQAIWTDTCYIKDFMRFGELRPDQLLKLAAMLNDLFGSADMAALALQHYDAKTGEQLWPQYMQGLYRGQAPAAPPLTV